jgi:ribosomal-protein-alanine N-acetyltransferase
MTKAVSDWLATWPMPFTPEMANHRIALAREAAKRGDALPYAITAKESWTLLGWITLNKDQDARQGGTLGYWLGEQFHRQGFAREALAALLQDGFRLLDLDVIEAGAKPENTGSFAVMRACRMVESGKRTVHAEARHRDELCIFYELDRNNA